MTTRKYAVLFICSLAIFAWVGLAQAQNPKTIKLPNGQEVVDIRGEWDDYIENYGPWSVYGNYTNVLEITFKGNKFYGFRMKDCKYHTRGSIAIRGELDKDGIKKVQIITGLLGPIDAKGQISEDGNKIIIDDGEHSRVTLIRK
jgi:hypothetical protein